MVSRFRYFQASISHSMKTLVNFDELTDYACGGIDVPYCLLGPPEGDGLENLPAALTNFQVNLVPEVPLPAALPLLASSMAGLGFLARRRKRKAAV